MKHLISINNLSNDELRFLVNRSVYFSNTSGQSEKSLTDKIVGIYFKKTSTRTRTGFSSGALRLGARIISYGPNDLQVNTGETLEDTRDILSGMLDCLVARTSESQQDFEILANQEKMSVINAMSSLEHPTQAITDLAAIKKHFGKVEGLNILYMGEGNNTAVALALALTRFKDVTIHFLCPAGYEMCSQICETAKRSSIDNGSRIFFSTDSDELPPDIDVVYTTRWQTTGTTKSDPDWKSKFSPFQVNENTMNRYKGAIFMHDLPAHRGEEVLASVLDGERSIAFFQAKFKMFSAMAILEHTILGLDNPFFKEFMKLKNK